MVVLASVAAAIQTSAGPYRLNITTDPPVVPVGKATLLISLRDSAGKPVAGAQIKGIVQMPGMPMGEVEQTAIPGDQPGAYRLPASFAMAGGYDAILIISGPLGEAKTTVPLETGASTLAGKSGFTAAILIWPLASIALVIFVLYRMRKRGQSLDVRSVFTGPVLASLLLLAVVIVVAVVAVNRFRRPGSMTPIEAQVMDMSAAPPEGTTPVVLATVEERDFNPTVRYSGQAVGFVEQEVYPRVSGTLIWMPGYVGTKVKKGQLIAKLDTSQTQPAVNEKRAMVRSAERGVGSAQADYEQALAGIAETEAERVQSESFVEEARASLKEAQEARKAAQSQVDEAESEVENAKAGVTSAEADLAFKREQLKRAESLLEGGYTAKASYERQKSETEMSAAALRQANQGVASAQAKLKTAQAEARQADAGVTVAQKRVEQARSDVKAKQARTRTARAAANSAKQKIGQATADVGAAQAGLEGAAATAGYTEIRSEADGVITERSVSPGVTVSPGQAILKIAQIQPIRVQANVPQSDLARVVSGSKVRIWAGERSQTPLLGRVTALSSSLDTSVRTGFVEAILPNTGNEILPGQFVSMEIGVGTDGRSLVIPSDALQSELQTTESGVISTETRNFVWLATPVSGQAGRFTISRVSVEAGAKSESFVSIIRGLQSGQQVISSPASGLRAGQIVTAVVPEAEPVARAQIEITDQGFVPPSITMKAGQPLEVTFVRRTDQTCAKEVVFPALKITKELPLNEPVTVRIPAQAEGELNYACAMDMFKGRLIVR